MIYKSVINDELWDKAHWVATAFAFPSVGNSTPIMAFVFENEKFALRIFQQWQSDFEKNDTKEQLRIAIIEGDIPGQPIGYTIHLTSNPEVVLKNADVSEIRDGQVKMATICRFQRMQSSEALTRFKSVYFNSHEFFIMPALYDRSTPSNIHPYTNLSILKRDIYFRNAKDISKSDLDSVIFRAQQ